MADPKDSDDGFFRKVVRFVANPTTDWADLNTRPVQDRAAEAERSELKAMVERKRRNDFVRKREFDMLRRVRRDGLTPEQLAALGSSSRLDDSDLRISEIAVRQDAGVKAKIDHIEREMVGDTDFRMSGRTSSSFGPPTGTGTTRPASYTMPGRLGPDRGMPPLPPALATDDGEPLPALPPLPEFDGAATQPFPTLHFPTAPAPLEPAPAAPPAPAKPLARSDTVAVPVARAAPTVPPAAGPSDVEVNEIASDPELDEAVMAFANADFALCESSLLQLTTPSGSRARHGETWLVLFDLYRAIGQQQRFESLAMDYALQFGSSAPQWFSMPKLVADAVAEERPRPPRPVGEVSWACPATLDEDAVNRLRGATLHMPLPWVFDWSALCDLDAEAAAALSALFRTWAEQPLNMHWLSSDQLLNVLIQAAPTGARDMDPAFWIARLDTLRLANRADQFDDVAIDYCVTYEVSPPAWEPARCTLRLSGTQQSTRGATLSVMSGISTSFVESSLMEEQGAAPVASVELTGQLVGDQSDTLRTLDDDLAAASIVNVSCARLIRVDFIAAGDLLNWVMAKRKQNRTVQFTEAHRLIALFFGAMGITEHARVQVRRN